MSARVYRRKFDWDEARRLHAEGWTYSALAMRFGVNRNSIAMACHEPTRIASLVERARIQASGTCCECGKQCSHNSTYNRRAGREPDQDLCKSCSSKAMMAVRFADGCSRGHPWTPENTRLRPSDGFRYCRTCDRERKARVRFERGGQCEVCGAPTTLDEAAGVPFRHCLKHNGGALAQAAKTHCPRGHPYSPENTAVYVDPRGKRGRTCLTCRRERDRARQRSAA